MEEDMTKVSIVIPCYNQGEYVLEAIQSARNQTVKCEIVVVNDGSTDHTDALCRPLKDITYIAQFNHGLPTARNVGIEAATGRAIVCLDSDDKLEPDYVKRCLTKLRKGVGIVRTGLRHFGDCDVVLAPSKYTELEDWFANNQAYPPAMFYKSTWRKVGGFDKSMVHGYEDWDYFLRIVAAGYKVETIEEPLFLYRKHGMSMVDRSREKHEELVNYIRSKHEGLCSNNIVR